MGENIRHSPKSTLTSISDLTDCANSGRKRKRDVMSSASSNYKPNLLRQHEILFSYLSLARLRMDPFTIFKGWDDVNLWTYIASNMRCSMSDIFNIIKHYQISYKEDCNLMFLEDSPLKSGIVYTFCPFLDPLTVQQIPTKGVSVGLVHFPPLSDELDGFRDEQEAASLLTGGNHKHFYSKSYGPRGKLTKQYIDDLKALSLTEAQKVQLIMKCGADSSAYMSVADDDPAQRLALLAAYLRPPSTSRSISSTSSSKRMRSKEGERKGEE